MKTWTLMALMLTGCFGNGDRGQSSKPDDGELSTFDQFTRWGLGIGGFTAPPSNGAGGNQDTASWGDDEDWTEADADGGWDEGSSDSGEIGACYFDGVCYPVVESACPDGGTWYSGECEDDTEEEGDWDGGEEDGSDWGDDGDWGDGGEDGSDWGGDAEAKSDWGGAEAKAAPSTTPSLEPTSTKVDVTVGGAK